MSEAADLAGKAASADPGIGLRAAAALRKLADVLERLQVQNARRQGWSWAEIAVSLQVSKQAVHKRYAAAAPDPGSRASPATPGPASTPAAPDPANAAPASSARGTRPTESPLEG